MENNSLKSKTVFGIIWIFAERCGAQIVSFIVSIILARLLTPADYGLVGLITVFIAISMVFAQSGLGIALVQKKNVDEKDFSTVFFFSLVFSVVLYFLLFLVAPTIAEFYNSPQLIPIIRVLGVTVVIGSINSVQQAYVQRTMKFKLTFYSALAGVFTSSIAGITAAYKGVGVWALVIQQITNQLTNTIVLWMVLKWRPKKVFCFEKMKTLFKFGWKMLVSSLIETIYSNIHSLIIGKCYSDVALGYYNRGKQFPMIIITNINTTIDTVLFPAMASEQSDREHLKSMTRRSIKISTFIIFPMMAGLAAMAEPIIKLLLTEKWLPAIPFIRFCCFTYAFMPIHTANLQAIKALGRSDIFLKVEIIKKIFGIGILCISVPCGLYAMMIGTCVSTIISMIINSYPNKKLLNYSFYEQLKDIATSIVASLIMCIIVLGMNLLNINLILLMILQIFVGVLVYILLARIFKINSLEYLINIVKELFIKKKTNA